MKAIEVPFALVKRAATCATLSADELAELAVEFRVLLPVPAAHDQGADPGPPQFLDTIGFPDAPGPLEDPPKHAKGPPDRDGPPDK